MDCHAADQPLAQAERRPLLRAVVGIGLYAGAFGATFGAVAVTAGLSPLQALALSVIMFTGASQFAFVGVASAASSPFAAIPAALLLGVRNAFYGVPMSASLRPRGLQRLWTAHFVIDETTAMALAQERPAARRFAFWVTGLTLCACWVTGTVAGAAMGASIDPAALGLDAAAPAVFLALLWPQLTTGVSVGVALAGAVVAAALVPVAPAGVPVIAAALLSMGVGLLGRVEERPDQAGVGAEGGAR